MAACSPACPLACKTPRWLACLPIDRLICTQQSTCTQQCPVGAAKELEGAGSMGAGMQVFGRPNERHLCPWVSKITGMWTAESDSKMSSDRRARDL